MTEYTNYAQFNVLSVTGRISSARVVQYDGSEFLSVNVITTLTKDGQEMDVVFTNGNGLLALHKKGFFGSGRQVTLTGHITEVSQYYTKADENGVVEAFPRKRPQVKMNAVQVLDGGLGPTPKKDGAANQVVPAKITFKTDSPAPAVDKTPVMTAEEAGF